jgi:hypothetical protein
MPAPNLTKANLQVSELVFFMETTHLSQNNSPDCFARQSHPEHGRKDILQ